MVSSLIGPLLDLERFERSILVQTETGLDFLTLDGWKCTTNIILTSSTIIYYYYHQIGHTRSGA